MSNNDTKDLDEDLPMSLRLLSERLKDNMPPNPLQTMPLLTSTQQRNQIRGTLDVSIQNLQRYTYDLKTYRNSIASINLLPDELLAHIFSEYCTIEEGGPWQAKWCKILYVCKRWKDCALATGQLWSCIGNEEYDSAGDVFSRMLDWHKLSKGYPLQFQFHLSGYSSESDYYAVLLKRTPAARIVSFELSGPPAKLRNFLSSADPFVFATNVAFKAGHSSTEIQPYHFPDHLFSFEKLQKLRLENVVFSSVDVFRRLSHLTSFVFKRVNRNMERLQLSDLLAVMRACPQLAHLELFNAVESSNSEVIHPADLPSLQSITLWTDAPMGNALLRSLQIPASAFINIETYGNYDDLDSLLQRLGAHFHRPGSPIFRSMFLSRGIHHNACTLGLFKTRNSPPGAELYLKGDDAPFRIGFPALGPARGQQLSLLRQLFHELPLHHIEHVNALGNTSLKHTGLSRRVWRTFFTFLPGPVSVSIGMNECLPVLLDGYLDSFLLSPKAAAGGRARSRLYRKSRAPITELTLHAATYMSESEKKRPSPAPKLIDFLQRYKELKLVNKPSGKPFEKIDLLDWNDSLHRDIYPLTNVTFLHGRRYDPEANKRGLVEDLWEASQSQTVHISPEDEKFLEDNRHNLDENGMWIVSAKTEPVTTERYEDEENRRRAWEEYEEYRVVLTDEFTNIFQ